MNGKARPSLRPASPVTEKFGSCSSSSPGGPDADVAGEDRVGRREDGAEDDRCADREAHGLVTEQRDRADRQRHRDDQQAPDAGPGEPGERSIQLQAGRRTGR